LAEIDGEARTTILFPLNIADVDGLRRHSPEAKEDGRARECGGRGGASSAKMKAVGFMTQNQQTTIDLGAGSAPHSSSASQAILLLRSAPWPKTASIAARPDMTIWSRPQRTNIASFGNGSLGLVPSSSSGARCTSGRGGAVATNYRPRK
jgi:hypothetical protein